MCLQYIVMASAASASPKYRHLAMTLYQRSRHYAELDEMRDQGEHFTTVAHAQCWILMAHFEAQNMMFSRASMSLTRSIRVAQMLHLHKIDTCEPRGVPVISPPSNWCELESRRRTFWVIFCADRLSSSTNEWPSMLKDKDVGFTVLMVF
jgi:hypothetical protein